MKQILLKIKDVKVLSRLEQVNINGGKSAVVTCGNGDEFSYPSGLTPTQIVAICDGHGGFVNQHWAD